MTLCPGSFPPPPVPVLRPPPFAHWITTILKSLSAPWQLAKLALGCPSLEHSLLFSGYLNPIHLQGSVTTSTLWHSPHLPSAPSTSNRLLFFTTHWAPLCSNVCHPILLLSCYTGFSNDRTHILPVIVIWPCHSKASLIPGSGPHHSLQTL